MGLPSKKGNNSKVCLKNNGNISFDPIENANIFKNFYENLASELVEKLPEPTDKFGKNKVKEYYKNLNLDDKNFEFHETTCDKVTKLLDEINPNKAVGIDTLSGRFLKDGASVLSTPMTSLCNLSIKLSKFPDKCKIAKLKTLYKKGSNLETKNYRPISLLPLISKIFEKIIHDQTQEYFDVNKVLYKYQSGFSAKHSTDTCLSLLN